MADGDLIISFRTKGEAESFIRATKGAKLSVEELAAAVVKAGGALGDVFDEVYNLNIGARVAGLNEVKGYKKVLSDTEQQILDLIRAIEKKNKADQGSLTNLRQSLNQAKQKLASMSKENAAYDAQTQRVNKLTEALRRAQGIEVGSLADINLNVKDLEKRLQIENLSADARQRLTNEINEYNVAAQRARGIEAGSIADLRQQQQEQERLAQSLRVGSDAQLQAAKNAKALGDQIAAATPKTFSLIGALNKVATVQAGIIAITAAIAQVAGSVDQVVKRLKAVESFDLALKNVGVSASESARFFQQAADTANSLGAPLEQVEKAYKRIVPPLKNIGATTEDTDKFIENLTARTQILGLSTEESGRYLEAFAQVLSKGKLQGEELNQQISELDGAFRGQLADALGVTTQELTVMVEKGEVTSDVFYKAFNSMQNGVELLTGGLESGNATIQQLQNSITNLNTKTLEEIGKNIEPGIRAFLAAAAAFSKLVNEIAKSPLGELLAEVFNQVAYATRALIDGLALLTKTLLLVINPIAKLLQLFTPLISVLVLLKTATLSAALAKKAFKVVLVQSKAAALANATSLQLLTGSVVKFGAAIKSLLTLKVGKFLSDLGLSATYALRALNIDIINRFIDALGRLRAAQAAGTTMDFVSVAGQRFKNSMSGLGDLINAIVFKLGAFTAKAKAAGQTIAKNVGDFFKFKRAADGTRIAYDGVGRAAANATVDISANAATVSREVVPALGKVGKTAGLANGQLARAGVGAGNFLKTLLNFGKATLVTAVVTAALQGLLQVLEGFSQGGDQAKQPLGELEGTLRQLGIQTKTTHGAWLGFLDDLRRIPGVEKVIDFIQQIGDKLKALGLAAGGDRGLSNLSDKFDDIEKAAKKAGAGGLNDFANASKLNKEEATQLVGGLRATEKAYEETAANIESQIAALKSSGGATQDQIEVLERQKQAAEQGADRANYYASEWENATKTQRESVSAIEKTGDALKDVKIAQQQYFNSIDADKQAQINALQDQYNKGQISSASFATQSANLQKQSTDQKLAAIAKEKAALENRAKTQTTVDYAAYRRIQELTQQEQALRSGAAVQTQQLSEEEIKAIQERQKAVESLAGSYKDLGSIASTAVNDLGSSVEGALESLADTITQQAVINFSITGDQSFLQQTLDNQGKILDFQYTIGALKIKQQQAEKQFELELQKLKIQTALIEAQSAAAGGDPIAKQMVEAYERQLAIIPQIQAANQITSDAALIGLEAETQQKQTQLNLAREAQGLPPVNIVDIESAGSLQSKFDGIYNSAKTAASQIGNAATTSINQGTQKLAQGVTGVNTAVAGTAGTAKQAGTAFEQAVTNLEQGIKKLSAAELTKGLQEGGKKGGEAFNAEVKKSPGLINQAVQAAKGLGDQFLATVNPIQRMSNEVRTVIGLVQQLSGAVGRIPSGSNARAMGGPVAGGQTYLVNDGGGREAFMNKTGQISLLPAGRNIKWRAPGDGFVLPAPMTASLVQNSQINAKIAAVNSASATRPNNAYSSGLSNSGNLIQQMGAMMGGATTQRITNNVTIQSQSPVMDASKIMANVARLKARRGIRG